MKTVAGISIATFIGAAVLLASPTPGPSPLQWVPAPGIQGRNVVAGSERGQPLHVCRAAYQGGVHPGKAIAGSCNIGWGGKEIVVRDHDVLVGDGRWSPKGTPGAFAAGYENGARLTLCRARFRESMHAGKVIGGTCNIGWGGEEKTISDFEVFVPAWRSAPSNEAVQLVMKNGSDDPVEVVWIDDNGEARSYGSLGAGLQRVQPTYRAHVWIVKRGATIVASHTATADPRQFLGVSVAPSDSDLEAGPIWNDGDADTKCPSVCEARGASWTKQWRTTVPGQTSVCRCRGFL